MAGHTEGELFFQGLWIWQGIQKVHTPNNLWRALLFPRVLDMATLGKVMDVATLFSNGFGYGNTFSNGFGYGNTR